MLDFTNQAKCSSKCARSLKTTIKKYPKSLLFAWDTSLLPWPELSGRG